MAGRMGRRQRVTPAEPPRPATLAEQVADERWPGSDRDLTADELRAERYAGPGECWEDAYAQLKTERPKRTTNREGPHGARGTDHGAGGTQ